MSRRELTSSIHMNRYDGNGFIEMSSILSQFDDMRRKEDQVRDEHDAVIATAKQKIAETEEKVRRAYGRLNKLERNRNKLPSTSWIDAIVEPLAKALSEFKGLPWEIFGPFGITCQTAIYLREDMTKSICNQPALSITLEPHYGPDGKFTVLYRTGETTNEYAQGTIGQINGMNCVKAPLPNTVEEIAALLRESELED